MRSTSRVYSRKEVTSIDKTEKMYIIYAYKGSLLMSPLSFPSALVMSPCAREGITMFGAMREASVPHRHRKKKGESLGRWQETLAKGRFDRARALGSAI